MQNGLGWLKENDCNDRPGRVSSKFKLSFDLFYKLFISLGYCKWLPSIVKTRLFAAQPTWLTAIQYRYLSLLNADLVQSFSFRIMNKLQYHTSSNCTILLQAAGTNNLFFKSTSRLKLV